MPRGAGTIRREVFDALRRIVRAGTPWRRLPTNFPPWPAVHQQTQRRITAGCFEAMAHDLRAILRWSGGWADAPTGAIVDRATRQSTPERGRRAGDDGHERRKGSKLHAAVETLGHLPALRVTPANAQDRDQVGALAEAVQEATGQAVEVAFVDRGDTGEHSVAGAAAHGIRLAAVKRPAAKRGFVLLPRRWVVERSFAWLGRSRRLSTDYEALPATEDARIHLAMSGLMLARLAP